MCNTDDTRRNGQLDYTGEPHPGRRIENLMVWFIATQLQEQSRASGRRYKYPQTAFSGKGLLHPNHFVVERFNRQQRYVHEIKY